MEANLTKFNILYKKYRIWVLLAIAIIFPLLTNNKYILHLCCISMMNSMLTISLNILSGFTGLMSVGHIAFYGLGAYTSAVLVTKVGVPVGIGILAGGIVAMFFGLLLGLPTMRLRGTYFCVATLAFGEVVFQLFKNLKSITNGTAGILKIPSIVIGDFTFKPYNRYYFIMLLALVLSIIVAHNLLRSRTGRAILAIRESDIAAEAMGINVVSYKLIAFLISTFMAGIAGALYCHEMCYVSPEPFAQSESSTILAMMVIGGIGSIPGAVLGAFGLTFLPEMLRFIGNFRLPLYGAAVVAIIIFAPAGLGGLLDKIDGKLCGRDKIIAAEHKKIEEKEGPTHGSDSRN